MIPFIGGTWNSQSHRERKWNSGYHSLGEGRMESYCLLGVEFQFGMTDRGDGGTEKVTELYAEKG